MKNFNLIQKEKSNQFGNPEFLKTYRFENGKGFPASYIHFVKQYGFGKTLGQYFIYIPMDNSGASWTERTEGIKYTYYEDVKKAQREKDISFGIKPYITKELIVRLIPFASSENGYYLFWDPESITKPNEFDIYLTDFRGVDLCKVASDLYELFERFTSEEYLQIDIFSRQPLPNTFEPLY